MLSGETSCARRAQAVDAATTVARMMREVFMGLSPLVDLCYEELLLPKRIALKGKMIDYASCNEANPKRRAYTASSLSNSAQKAKSYAKVYFFWLFVHECGWF